MLEAYISEDQLMIERHGMLHVFPLTATGIWCELLGYSNVLDAVEAIMRKDVDQTEPEDVDESPWTEPMVVATHLETVREVAAEKALTEGRGVDPRSPELRATFAVREEIKRLSAGGEGERSLVAAVQRRARDVLRAPEPECVPSAVRGTRVVCEAKPQCVETMGKPFLLDPDEREQLVEVFRACAAECPEGCSRDHYAERLTMINDRKRSYAHQLTGRAVDPLAPQVPEPVHTEDAVAARLGLKETDHAA